MAAANVLQPSLKEAVGSESFCFGDGDVGQLLTLAGQEKCCPFFKMGLDVGAFHRVSAGLSSFFASLDYLYLHWHDLGVFMYMVCSFCRERDLL